MMNGEATVDLENLLDVYNRKEEQAAKAVTNILSEEADERFLGYSWLHQKLTQIEGKGELRDNSRFYVPLLVRVLGRIATSEKAKGSNSELLTVLNLLSEMAENYPIMPLNGLVFDDIAIADLKLRRADMRAP